MNHLIKEQFNLVAKQYDRQRKQLIPCFDDFYGIAVLAAETGLENPEILDLGAGTGLLTAFVINKYPQARFTLIDFSENMLEQARARFADRQAETEIRYIVGDYSQYPFDQTYDIVISSLSVHHLPHPEKRKLFHNIYHHLKDGGLFINADQVGGTSSYFDTYFRKQWDQAVQMSGLQPEEIEASRERRKLDLNATAAEQLEWLRTAGFAEVECMYRYFDFAVFYAKK